MHTTFLTTQCFAGKGDLEDHNGLWCFCQVERAISEWVSLHWAKIRSENFWDFASSYGRYCNDIIFISFGWLWSELNWRSTHFWMQWKGPQGSLRSSLQSERLCCNYYLNQRYCAGAWTRTRGLWKLEKFDKTITGNVEKTRGAIVQVPTKNGQTLSQ